LMILASRRWPRYAQRYGLTKVRWPATETNGQFLTGATVGLVSASRVARAVLELLKPFACRVLLYDPYLTSDAACELGAELTSLDDLFSRSDIVSVHVPALPTTRGMIDGNLLR